MKYIKTYEALSQEEKEEFIKMNAEPSNSFNLNKLREDCLEYNIVFFDLIKEMVLNKKITFHCDWCYNKEFTEIEYRKKNKWSQKIVIGHNVICQCVDISRESGDWKDPDIGVKINNDEQWHTLFAYDPKKNKKAKKVRIYNYTEGPLSQELEMLKNAKKYNL